MGKRLTNRAAQSKALGLSPNAVHERLRMGWPEELAVSLPAGSRVKSRKGGLSQKARDAGLPVATVIARVRRYGWPEKQALATPVGATYVVTSSKRRAVLRRDALVSHLLGRKVGHEEAARVMRDLHFAGIVPRKIDWDRQMTEITRRAYIAGLYMSTVRARLARGVPIERAISEPVTKRGKPFSKLALKVQQTNLSMTTVTGRLRRGWSEKRALTTPILATHQQGWAKDF